MVRLIPLNSKRMVDPGKYLIGDRLERPGAVSSFLLPSKHHSGAGLKL